MTPPKHPARTLLNDLFGDAFDFVVERAADMAPRCCICAEVAIPLRCACGHFACKDHGFFNLVTAAVICPCCAAKLGTAPHDAPYATEQSWPPPPEWARRARARRQKRREARQAPGMDVAAAWELLGLDPATATEDDVKKTARQLAFTCHPDLHRDDPQAAKKFKLLQRAKTVCMHDLANR